MMAFEAALLSFYIKIRLLPASFPAVYNDILSGRCLNAGNVAYHFILSGTNRKPAIDVLPVFETTLKIIYQCYNYIYTKPLEELIF